MAAVTIVDRIYSYIYLSRAARAIKLKTTDSKLTDRTSKKHYYRYQSSDRHRCTQNRIKIHIVTISPSLVLLNIINLFALLFSCVCFVSCLYHYSLIFNLLRNMANVYNSHRRHFGGILCCSRAASKTCVLGIIHWSNKPICEYSTFFILHYFY